MNMKTLFVVLMLGASMSALAQEQQSDQPEQQDQQSEQQSPAAAAPGTNPTQGQQQMSEADITNAFSMNGDAARKCNAIAQAYQANKAMVDSNPQMKYQVDQCQVFKNLSDGGNIQPVSARESSKASSDGRVTCKMKASYTADYEACEKALNFYTAVVVAEQAMNLQQTIRTDLKNQNIQKKTQQEMATGASQTAMFDAAAESNKHQKGIQQEKMIQYAAAVAALVKAHGMIPSIDKISKQNCPMDGVPAESCQKIIMANRNTIAANGDAKSALLNAIMEFTAKGAAAGIAMGQYGNAAKMNEEAKKSLIDDGQDLMVEACVLNPTDPACAKTGTRVSGQTVQSGNFGFDGDGLGNAFNLSPDSEVVPEMGAETNLGDNAPISDINSPFAEDAKIAKGILDPAAAAQMQATGGAQGGGGGGAGGGMGGGGASLGSDLNGANKEGDKEAQIKTNKVSGQYANGGGGGYKGVSRSKDDANPFSSLFDAKGAGGGVEEDRSIASGDIDGAASGLFQKISKRYGQIQADKRIEAKNLE